MAITWCGPPGGEQRHLEPAPHTRATSKIPNAKQTVYLSVAGTISVEIPTVGPSKEKSPPTVFFRRAWTDRPPRPAWDLWFVVRPPPNPNLRTPVQPTPPWVCKIAFRSAQAKSLIAWGPPPSPKALYKWVPPPPQENEETPPPFLCRDVPPAPPGGAKTVPDNKLLDFKPRSTGSPTAPPVRRAPGEKSCAPSPRIQRTPRGFVVGPALIFQGPAHPRMIMGLVFPALKLGPPIGQRVFSRAFIALSPDLWAAVW